MIKKLDQFILKSYLGPFILTFFISIFVLLMQFLWKYLEDLVGKGLELNVVAELILYATAGLVPMALPLSILLSSIMTFGNLGEHYELAALKASGISLQRVMKPLVMISILTSIGAFVFSNYILPYANLKFGSLLYDIMNQKPSLNIKEGVYYSGIDGYVMRVGKKDKEGPGLHKIFIYDHTQRKGANKVVVAESGRMEMSKDERFLLLTLFDGNVYEEIQNESNPDAKNKPFVRTSFKEENIRFDLSSFQMTRTKEDLFKDNYQMMNIFQLQATVDTINMEMDQRKIQLKDQLLRNVGVYKDSVTLNMPYDKFFDGDVLKRFNKTDKQRIVEAAMNILRGSKSYIEASVNDLNARNHMIVRNDMEWHRKFTLSIACLVLFFIGAPLGAIVRKGGLGMPVVLSVLFFLGFHIISITGEKFAKEEVWTPLKGMWMGTMILFPIGFFLTFKATSDSKLFDLDFYLTPIKKLFSRKKTSAI